MGHRFVDRLGLLANPDAEQVSTVCWGKFIQEGLVRHALCAGGRSYRVVWLGMYCVKGEGHTG